MQPHVSLQKLFVFLLPVVKCKMIKDDFDLAVGVALRSSCQKDLISAELDREHNTTRTIKC